MKKTKDTSAKPVSLTEAARLVSAHEGKKITRQGLTDYLAKHPVTFHKIGKRNKVMIADVLDARQSFTREVMRGDHLDPAPETQKPSSPKLVSSSAVSAARDAKTRKEQAQAERAELDLARQKEELIPAPAAEAAAASAMMAAKSYFIGPAIGQTADALLAALKLPETAKREIEPVLDVQFRDVLNRFSKTLTEEFSRLNTGFAPGLPSRLEMLTHQAARLRSMDAQALAQELTNYG